MGQTTLGLPYPASTAVPRVWEDIQALADAMNALLTLPAPAAESGTTSTITATSWTGLPTSNPSPTLTNPHATRGMLVDVRYSGWLATTGPAVRCVPRVWGDVTIAAGIGTGALNWGEVLYTATAGTQCSASFLMTVPAGGTVTADLQAYRDSASGTQTVNYSTLRLIPLRYV